MNSEEKKSPQQIAQDGVAVLDEIFNNIGEVDVTLKMGGLVPVAPKQADLSNADTENVVRIEPREDELTEASFIISPHTTLGLKRALQSIRVESSKLEPHVLDWIGLRKSAWKSVP